MKYICAQSKEDRQHPWIGSPAYRRVSVGFPSRPTARLAMTLLCKSRKRRRRRAIGAALTLRKSSPSSSLSSRSASDLENVRRTTARSADARGYYLARKFLLRTQGFFFTRVITSLPRKAVPATPQSDPYFILFFFYLPRSLSCLSSSCSSYFYPLSFSLSVAQIYIQRQGPTRHTRERRGARVSGALSLLPLSKANLLCTVFRGKSS